LSVPPITSYNGLLYTRLDGQHSPLRPYLSAFSRAEKPSEDMAFISDEYERVEKNYLL
jgi:hypothetical protein